MPTNIIHNAQQANGTFIVPFNSSDMSLEKNDNDLVFKSKNNEQITIEGYYDVHSEANPGTFVIDGQEVDGEEFFQAFGEELMPAAGPSTSAPMSGGTIVGFGSGSLLGGIDRLGGLDQEREYSDEFVEFPEAVLIDSLEEFQLPLSDYDFGEEELSEYYFTSITAAELKSCFNTNDSFNIYANKVFLSKIDNVDDSIKNTAMSGFGADKNNQQSITFDGVTISAGLFALDQNNNINSRVEGTTELVWREDNQSGNWASGIGILSTSDIGSDNDSISEVSYNSKGITEGIIIRPTEQNAIDMTISLGCFETDYVEGQSESARFAVTLFDPTTNNFFFEFHTVSGILKNGEFEFLYEAPENLFISDVTLYPDKADSNFVLTGVAFTHAGVNPNEIETFTAEYDGKELDFLYTSLTDSDTIESLLENINDVEVIVYGTGAKELNSTELLNDIKNNNLDSNWQQTETNLNGYTEYTSNDVTILIQSQLLNQGN